MKTHQPLQKNDFVHSLKISSVCRQTADNAAGSGPVSDTGLVVLLMKSVVFGQNITSQLNTSSKLQSKSLQLQLRIRVIIDTKATLKKNLFMFGNGYGIRN